jgi:hypothetical protein
MRHFARILTAPATLFSASLLAASVVAPALAQDTTTQTPMMSGPMMWGMVLICVLGVIVLILGAAALIKYLFFR